MAPKRDLISGRSPCSFHGSVTSFEFALRVILARFRNVASQFTLQQFHTIVLLRFNSPITSAQYRSQHHLTRLSSLCRPIHRLYARTYCIDAEVNHSVSNDHAHTSAAINMRMRSGVVLTSLHLLDLVALAFCKGYYLPDCMSNMAMTGEIYRPRLSMAGGR